METADQINTDFISKNKNTYYRIIEHTILPENIDVDTILSLLRGAESDAGGALPVFAEWCVHSLLDLNVSKTFHWKELVVDF